MMNKRIKELAVQARNYALDEKRIYERMHNTEQCMEEYREVYNKRFAELIVRECARLAIEKQTENDVSGIVSKNPAKDFAYALVEHFGVKE
jgi:phenolic acid decarboxylase